MMHTSQYRKIDPYDFILCSRVTYDLVVNLCSPCRVHISILTSTIMAVLFMTLSKTALEIIIFSLLLDEIYAFALV